MSEWEDPEFYAWVDEANAGDAYLDVDPKSSCEFVKAVLLCEPPRTFAYA